VDIRENEKRDLILNATKERGKTMVELAGQIELVLNAPVEYNAKNAKKAFKGEASEILELFKVMLQESGATTPAEYHALMEQIVAKREIGFGKIGQPLRVALLGSMTGSGLDEIMAILGVDESVTRIEKAIAFMNS
jgi:glutamyl-tRNA synthetase